MQTNKLETTGEMKKTLNLNSLGY